MNIELKESAKRLGKILFLGAWSAQSKSSSRAATSFSAPPSNLCILHRILHLGSRFDVVGAGLTELQKPAKHIWDGVKPMQEDADNL